MAMVQCPECGTSVGSAAAACPQCAYPISQSGLRAGKLQPVATGRVVTVEKTGKDIKLQMLLAKLLATVSALALLVGVGMFVVALNAKDGINHESQIAGGLLLALGGLLGVVLGIILKWYVGAKRWWRHA